MRLRGSSEFVVGGGWGGGGVWLFVLLGGSCFCCWGGFWGSGVVWGRVRGGVGFFGFFFSSLGGRFPFFCVREGGVVFCGGGGLVFSFFLFFSTFFGFGGGGGLVGFFSFGGLVVDVLFFLFWLVTFWSWGEAAAKPLGGLVRRGVFFVVAAPFIAVFSFCNSGGAR